MTVLREVEMTGPTVKEAVGRALLKLGMTAEEVDVDVVAEPRKGLFGAMKPAVVRVSAKAGAGSDSDATAPPAQAQPAQPDAPTAAPTNDLQPTTRPEEPEVTDTDA